MVALEATWSEACQVCLLKDSSLLHRMAPTLALVLQDQGVRMGRTLLQEGHHLGLSSSSSSSSNSNNSNNSSLA